MGYILVNWRTQFSDTIAANLSFKVVIGLSGGKDSTAVALLFAKTFPELHDKVDYVFSDTGAELPETYAYLKKLEEHFGKPIVRLKSKLGDLTDIIDKFNGYLPSPISRYCTRLTKILPFRDYMDDLAKTHDLVFSLIGIRADEPTRTGYIPCGDYAKKVITLFPLADEGMNLDAVFALVTAEIGLPDYYRWRTRSGCYFCFYQRRIEWVNLLEEHPELFAKAKAMEKTVGDKQFTWIQGMTLGQLEEQQEAIKERYFKKLGKTVYKREKLTITDSKIFEKLMQELEPDWFTMPCGTCR